MGWGVLSETEGAIALKERDPENVFYSIKRFMEFEDLRIVDSQMGCKVAFHGGINGGRCVCSRVKSERTQAIQMASLWTHS